jgi:hypothetical protein
MALPVRARDLRANIKELGFEAGIITTLEALLDEFASLRQSMVQMATLQNQLIDVHARFSQALSGIGDKVTSLEKNDIERTERQFRDIRE